MGEKTADQVRRKLIDMVNSAALLEAHRRRATAIDSTDYEKAFDQVAGPPKREHAVAIVADVATAAGTGLMGYATNVYTGSAPGKTHGHLAMIGGVILVVIGIVLKYIIHWKMWKFIVICGASPDASHPVGHDALPASRGRTPVLQQFRVNSGRAIAVLMRRDESRSS